MVQERTTMEAVRDRLPGVVCLLECCWPLPPHAAGSSSSPLHRHQQKSYLLESLSFPPLLCPIIGNTKRHWLMPSNLSIN